ncbi:MAG TPA: hypothetical protein VLX92_11940 [Kofleriaceae bacterium]|nr:hypothetical protein [Kofleriaceae bacterium]
MHQTKILLALAAATIASGCKSTSCGDGTIDKNGTCVPADETTGTAACGPFTMLEGNQCVPMFPPTTCDPATTMPDTDPTTGVTTCIGTGGGGCGAPFACPTPSSGSKQTICGQLYDLESNQPFADTGATGAMCAATPTASGPCSLAIQAYDAIAFGMNPTTTPPLANGGVYIDDCGRYRVTDIDVPSGPFIGLGIDDPANPGPGGTTNTVGVATPDNPGNATKDFEAWIVTQATTDGWTSSGGPPLSGGIYVGIFRTHMLGNGDPLAVQSGVTFTKSGTPIPGDDFYFTAAQTTHDTIDPTATATGANGTGLLINVSVNDSLVYSGTGGITDTVDCKWETHAAAALANIVFVQIYRPQNQLGKTCAQ